MTRPRCSSGKKRTRRFCDSAQRKTAGAFDDVQTTPPRSPQNAFSAAVELMYVTGSVSSVRPAPASSSQHDITSSSDAMSAIEQPAVMFGRTTL